MRRAVLAAIALTFALAGMAHAVTTWGVGTLNAGPEAILRDKIMAEHARYCAPLTFDSRLANAARYKVMDMGYRVYFAHAFLDGKRIWQFYGAVGMTYHNAAEILAWNNYPDDQSAAGAFSQFMGSSDHRAVIRSCTYTRLGVGAFRSAARRLFAVEFLRP